jgi:hypothetical protein
VPYLVVYVKTWRPGGEVLLAPAWVDRIDWSESGVVTEMSADDLRACPPYSPHENLNREYEERLHDHLGQSKYWMS